MNCVENIKSTYHLVSGSVPSKSQSTFPWDQTHANPTKAVLGKFQKAKELRLHYPDCDESGPQRQAKSLVLRVKTHERPSWCSYNAGSETAESGQLLRRNSARRYVIGRRDGAHKGGDAEVTAETTDRTSSRLLASASFSLRIKGDDGGFPPSREEAWYGQAEAVFADVWPFSQEKALVWREALTYYQTIASKSFRSTVKQEVSP